MGEEISNGQKYFLLFAMILSGAANTIVYNAQNSTITDLPEKDKFGKEVDVPYAFNHPFMQAMTMFIGEFSVISAFLITKKSTQSKKDAYDAEKEEEARAKNLSTSWKKFIWLLIPAGSDFFTSTLQYISLNYINPSIYQMLRGGVILVTAIFSSCFLKRTIYKHMILGCTLVFIGIALVGTSGFAFPEQDNGSQASGLVQGIAMGLIVLSLVFNGCLFVSEEFLFGKFYLHPFQVVGTEGFWGIIIYGIALPILSNVNCPLESLGKTCVVYPIEPNTVDEDGNVSPTPENLKNSYFESPALYFKQMGDDGFLAFLIIAGVATIAIFNVCGVNVTKHISSLTRSVADVSRTLLVWIASIIVTVTAGATRDNFKWENLRAGAIIMEVVGFLILVFGNFVYNGIVKIPNFLPPDQEEQTENLSDDPLLAQKDISMQEPKEYDSDDDLQVKGKTQRAKRSMGHDSFHN